MRCRDLLMLVVLAGSARAGGHSMNSELLVAGAQVGLPRSTSLVQGVAEDLGEVVDLGRVVGHGRGTSRTLLVAGADDLEEVAVAQVGSGPVVVGLDWLLADGCIATRSRAAGSPGRVGAPCVTHK